MDSVRKRPLGELRNVRASSGVFHTHPPAYSPSRPFLQKAGSSIRRS